MWRAAGLAHLQRHCPRALSLSPNLIVVGARGQQPLKECAQAFSPPNWNLASSEIPNCSRGSCSRVVEGLGKTQEASLSPTHTHTHQVPTSTLPVIFWISLL